MKGFSLQMRAMDADAYTVFRVTSHREYVKNVMRNQGLNLADAEIYADKQIRMHLPDEQLTQDNYFFELVNDQDEQLGFLWYGVREYAAGKKMYIFDIMVKEEERGRGLGRFMLAWLEDRTRELGLDEIALHAFGFNTRAIELYKSLGYEITNVNMAKKL